MAGKGYTIYGLLEHKIEKGYGDEDAHRTYDAGEVTGMPALRKHLQETYGKAPTPQAIHKSIAEDRPLKIGPHRVSITPLSQLTADKMQEVLNKTGITFEIDEAGEGLSLRNPIDKKLQRFDSFREAADFLEDEGLVDEETFNYKKKDYYSDRYERRKAKTEAIQNAAQQQQNTAPLQGATQSLTQSTGIPLDD